MQKWQCRPKHRRGPLLSSNGKQRMATPTKGPITVGSHEIGVRAEYKSWGKAGTDFSFTFTFEAHLQAKAPVGESCSGFSEARIILMHPIASFDYLCTHTYDPFTSTDTEPFTPTLSHYSVCVSQRSSPSPSLRLLPPSLLRSQSSMSS